MTTYTSSTECGGKLYNDDNLLTPNEVNDICTFLKEDPLFIIRIQKKSSILIQGSVFIDAETAKFLTDNCEQLLTSGADVCEDGFLIDLYTQEKIFVIQSGPNSKKSVNAVYRERVIETIRNYLFKGEWAIGLENAIKMLTYKQKGGATVINLAESYEPNYFTYYVLIPILIIMFLCFTFSLSFLERGVLNKDLFDFIDQMLKYWEQIENTEDKRIYFPEKKCLFCFDDKNTYRFMYCNHSYHEACLYKWRIIGDKCCPCGYVPVEGEESGIDNPNRPPILTIADITIILGMLLDAHRKESVYDYFLIHEKEIAIHNEKYDTSLEELCWIYQNKLNSFKNYRILSKSWKSLKLMCCLINFFPSSWFNSKKGKLVRRLFNIKARGASVRGFK